MRPNLKTGREKEGTRTKSWAVEVHAFTRHWGRGGAETGGFSWFETSLVYQVPGQAPNLQINSVLKKANKTKQTHEKRISEEAPGISLCLSTSFLTVALHAYSRGHG